MNDLLLIAVLPVFILAYYIYKKDINREPASLLVKIFFLGFFSAIPIMFLETFLDIFFSTDELTTFFPILFNVFISIAMVEEGFKWFIAKRVGYDSPEFDEIYDVIVYTVFASLGFACIENILYVFNYGALTGILRALTSIPGHTCFAVIMGYFMSLAKLNHMKKNLLKKNMFLSIFIPTFFHAIYDALLIYSVNADSVVAGVCFFVFNILTVIWCFLLVRKTSKAQQRLNNDKKIVT